MPERPTACASCGKRLSKKQQYYRNGKFYCKKRCWETDKAKAAKEAQESKEAAAAAEPKPEAAAKQPDQKPEAAPEQPAAKTG